MRCYEDLLRNFKIVQTMFPLAFPLGSNEFGFFKYGYLIVRASVNFLNMLLL